MSPASAPPPEQDKPAAITPAERPASTGPVQFDIDIGRMVFWLVVVWLSIDVLLLLLDYNVSYSGVHIYGALRRLTNVAREDSLANLFAVIQVLLLALTTWLVYFSVRKAGGTKFQRRGWFVVACMFSYMTIDDGSRLHERVGSAVGKLLEAKAAAGSAAFDAFPSYTWQVVFLPAFAGLGLFTLYFLWNELKPEYSRLLVVTGIGCLVVAVGMDFFEGLREESSYNPYTWIAGQIDMTDWTKRSFHSTPYATLMHFSKNLEEITEMFGITLLWVAVLRHWTRFVGELRVRFS
jgi:hypothetical protein